MKIKINIILITVIVLICIAVIFCIKEIIYIDNYNEKINDNLSDNLEIEKKWIIDKNKIPFELSNAEIFEIEQTYICFSP